MSNRGLSKIETAFGRLKNKQTETDLQGLSNALTEEFKKHIDVSIPDDETNLSRFVMSVTPAMSTLDKVLNYALDNTSKVDTIMSIWKGSNAWRLEINKKLFNMLSIKELAALTCHEVWHVIYSDRAVKRLQEALTFAVTSGKPTPKNLLNSGRFKKLLRIPGLISCQLTFNKSDMIKEASAHKKFIQQEIQADSFAAAKGYRTDLISAIDKLSVEIKRSSTLQKNIDSATMYSAGIVEDLGKRRDALAIDKMKKMRSLLSGTGVVFEECCDIYDNWFEDRPENYMEEYVEKYSGQIFEELGFFGKNLPPIEVNQINYAYVKADAITSTTDKLMLLSYVNSKLEIIEWYISIIDDEKLSKKYVIPHSRKDLIGYKVKFEAIRDKILRTQVATDDRNFVVYYPQGYEG